MLIGELALRSGLSRDTIRYYEKLRVLVVAAPRGDAGAYKNYTLAALARLRHILQLKGVGFTLREIQALLVADANGSACGELPERLARKIQTIDQQVALLLESKTALLDMQEACNGSCDAPDGLPSCVPAARAARPTPLCT